MTLPPKVQYKYTSKLGIQSVFFADYIKLPFSLAKKYSIASKMKLMNLVLVANPAYV